MRIYRNQYGWSLPIKSKDKNGKELKKYMPVKFANKYTLEPSGDEANIECDKWFHSLYERTDKLTNVVTTEVSLVIMKWHSIEDRPYEQNNAPDVKQNTLGGELTDPSDFSINIQPDDLPFY